MDSHTDMSDDGGDWSLVDEVDGLSWDTLQEAKKDLKDSARLEGTRIKQASHAADRLVYRCSFYQNRRQGCQFCIVVRQHQDDGRWHCTVETPTHSGHDVGDAPEIRRRRTALSQWVRKQVLTFDRLDCSEDKVIEVTAGDLEPTLFRSIDLRPVDPDEVGHIRIDRWIYMTGDGYEALGLIFNKTRDRVVFDLSTMLRDEETQSVYVELYGDLAEMASAAFNLVFDQHGMSDDAAQFMVDLTGQALILCQQPSDDEEEDTEGREVSLLVPRIFPAGGCEVASRCLIFSDQTWSVGEWSLPGHTRAGGVPLYGLPVMHPFWREAFWTNRRTPHVDGFENWGRYASHDAYRSRPDLETV